MICIYIYRSCAYMLFSMHKTFVCSHVHMYWLHAYIIIFQYACTCIKCKWLTWRKEFIYIYTYLLKCTLCSHWAGLLMLISAGAMPGEEPELRGFARMVGSGVGSPKSWEMDWRVVFWIHPNNSLMSIPLGHFFLRKKPQGWPSLPAMVLRRATTSFLLEEELRDLLTYECSITGKKRCPPYSLESRTSAKSSKFPSCKQYFFYSIWM